MGAVDKKVISRNSSPVQIIPTNCYCRGSDGVLSNTSTTDSNRVFSSDSNRVFSPLLESSNGKACLIRSYIIVSFIEAVHVLVGVGYSVS